jgi:hypothetical protein
VRPARCRPRHEIAGRTAPGSVAEQVAVVFVAMVLNRFGIELVSSAQPFPLAEEGNPVLGLMDAKKGYDPQAKLIDRA